MYKEPQTTRREEIFNEVMKYDEALHRYALSLTKNEEDAADLQQEMYLKVLSNASSFEGSNVRSWAYTIMRNTFINSYRRKKAVNIFFDDSEFMENLSNTISNPTDAADIHYSVNEIMKHVSEKNDDQRIPFEMMLDGYRYEEIAQKLQLPLGSVKSRIFYMRKKLMSDLSGYWCDPAVVAV